MTSLFYYKYNLVPCIMDQLRYSAIESKKVRVVAIVVLLVCLSMIAYKREQSVNNDIRSITVDEFANHSEIK